MKRTFNNQKVCVLADVTKASQYEKEARDFMSSELKNIFKAMAIVSGSQFGRAVANNLVVPQILDPDAVPMKMFSSEAEAKKWLKNYL